MSKMSPFEVEDFEYKGFQCTVVQFGRAELEYSASRFMDMIDSSSTENWWLGYVILPKNHKYCDGDYHDIPIDCHGDLTYGDTLHWEESKNHGEFALGFDFNHSSDHGGSKKQVINECKKIVDQLTLEIKSNG